MPSPLVGGQHRVDRPRSRRVTVDIRQGECALASHALRGIGRRGGDTYYEVTDDIS
jgi:hypothetical protein